MNMIKFAFRIPVALVLMFSTVNSFAGDSPTLLSMSIEDLMNVRVKTASRSSETLDDAPATVVVITKEDIRNRGYSYLKDVLHDLPGMQVVENYFSEVGTLVPVRGIAGNNKIVVMVNGMRINPPGGENLPLRSDMSIRNAERIEIVYGPGSTMYGQDAISAVINIITAEPQDDAAEMEVTAIGGMNRHGEVFAAVNDVITTPSDNTLRVSAYVHYQKSELDDLSRTFPEWWSIYEDFGSVGHGKDARRWNDGLNVLARVQGETCSLQLWHRESSRSSSEGGFAPILFYVDEAVWHDRSTVIEARNIEQLSDKLQIVSTVTFNRYEIDDETRYVWPDSASSLFMDDNKYGIGTSTLLAEQFDYTVSKCVRIVGGVEAGHFDITPKATIPGGADTGTDIVSQGGTFTYYTGRGDAASKVVIPKAYNLVYQNYAGYAEGHVKVTAPLSLVCGIRADCNTLYSQIPLSPRLAGVYRISNELVFKYIYTEAYVAPSPYFGYSVFDNGSTLFIPSSDLEPEEAASHEINASYTRRNLRIAVSAYHNKQSNLIISDEQAPAIGTVWMDADGTQERQLRRSANGGETEVHGADVYARYEIGRASLWGSYTHLAYFKSTLDEATSDLAGISEHNARLGCTVGITRSIIGTLSSSVQSTPRNIDGGILNDQLTNPYEIDLHVRYLPAKNIEVFGTILNLTDNRYALQGIVTPTPQEGLTWEIGITHKF